MHLAWTCIDISVSNLSMRQKRADVKCRLTEWLTIRATESDKTCHERWQDPTGDVPIRRSIAIKQRRIGGSYRLLLAGCWAFLNWAYSMTSSRSSSSRSAVALRTAFARDFGWA